MAAVSSAEDVVRVRLNFQSDAGNEIGALGKSERQLASRRGRSSTSLGSLITHLIGPQSDKAPVWFSELQLKAADSGISSQRRNAVQNIPFNRSD